MRESEASLGQRAKTAAAWTGGGLLLSAGATMGFLNHAEAEVPFGTHVATISPTTDGHSTLGVETLPRLRVPSDAPLNFGANIEVANTPNMRESLQRDLTILFSSKTERDYLEDVASDLVFDSGLKGLGLGAVMLAGIGFIRRNTPEHLFGKEVDSHHNSRVVGGIVLGLVAGTTYLQGTSEGNLSEDSSIVWVNAVEEIPELQKIDDNLLNDLEIEQGLLTEELVKAFNSMAESFYKSQSYYDEILTKVPEIESELRKPDTNQLVAIHLTDRHLNIQMDKIWRAIGDGAGATVVIDTGDDLSSGLNGESFSLRSVNAAFEGYDKVYSGGNHDETFVIKYMENLGWVVLKGKPVDVAGIRFLGISDPRRSNVTERMIEQEGDLERQAEEMAEIACEDGNVSTIAVHDIGVAAIAAARGCIDLGVAGHVHARIEEYTPNEIPLITTGTSGGAAFAVAFGTKLKRMANASLITYQLDGDRYVPVGMQSVDITTKGEIEPGIYQEFPIQPELTDEAQPAETESPQIDSLSKKSGFAKIKKDRRGTILSFELSLDQAA